MAHFIIKTQQGMYVGQMGFTPVIDDATRFTSRWTALSECQRLGAIVDHAAIVPYSPQERPAGISGPIEPKWDTEVTQDGSIEWTRQKKRTRDV